MTPGRNEPLASALETALGVRVAGLRPVGGGDVDRALAVDLAGGGRLFVKVAAGHPRPRPRREHDARRLRLEAKGLAWLAEPGTIPVPEVLACIDDPPALVLEWIEPGAGGSDEALGRSLAALHGAGAAGFGAVPDNFIGPLPQRNDERPTWPRFYAECRVEPQVRTARDAGALDAEEARRFRTLCEAMEARTGPAEPPARLHGDLWSGNAVRGADGRTWLVDPAVYGGHREVDLAMMRLFGGFAPRCFDAYEEAAPLAPGWAERVALYQIYPLLVHVNLFGIGYKDQLFQALHSVL